MIRDVIKRNNVTVHGEGTQVMLMASGYGCDLKYVEIYYTCVS
jgi:hypothetical protein